MKSQFIITKVIILTFLLFHTSTILRAEDLFIQGKNNGETVQTITKKIQDKKNLNRYYSNKRLGSFVENNQTIFRLFTPNANDVILCTFKQPEDVEGEEYAMIKDKDGVWEAKLEGELYGLYYGYKVYQKGEELKTSEKDISVDPYAKAVTSYTTYLNPRKAIVYKDDYNWEDDSWIERDWRDLIIYEMHIKDMTAHPSSGAMHSGTYRGLVENGITGGIDYIKSLGVNTVELLPAMEFGNIEIPYKDTLNGQFNSWNPYERNHWGYMTSNFFAPSAYYSEDWNEMKMNAWMGKNGKQVNDFKDVVKAFHNEGIAVMIDVVYNHLSEYELGNLKEIDREYYFRLDDSGNYIAESYCGNDIKTERPMVRRLIIDSIIYWMREYHIDGFRFDLGKLIDWQTIEDIIREARKINPNVVIVCEPWGGGYDPAGFSLREWSSWNDQIRNGIKGENPSTGPGWIFGEWYGNNNIERIKSYVNGTLVRDKHGLFQKKEHSVNYLESHDGYTLGDFIRIGTKQVYPEKIIKNLNKHVKLTTLQKKLNKLAALFLFTSQGITMIHSGQEFARSKVIPFNIDVNDKHKGMIDHNSYNKDNETNYINFEHQKINKDLFNYYTGLIELRKTFNAFRHTDYENIIFFEIAEHPFALAYLLEHKDQKFFVAFNANQKNNVTIKLPDGEWDVLVNNKKAGINSLAKIKDEIYLKPISGAVLKFID